MLKGQCFKLLASTGSTEQACISVLICCVAEQPEQWLSPSNECSRQRLRLGLGLSAFRNTGLRRFVFIVASITRTQGISLCEGKLRAQKIWHEASRSRCMARGKPEGTKQPNMYSDQLTQIGAGELPPSLASSKATHNCILPTCCSLIGACNIVPPPLHQGVDRNTS